MRLLPLACLFLAATSAAAQTPPAPPPLAPDVETVYSDAQRDADESLSRRAVTGVLAPADGTESGQYARWKEPVCFNVYGLSVLAKYQVETRLKAIAQQVGAQIDRAENCAPNILIAFTADPGATLESIARVRPWLVPGLGMIRSRTRESLPIQAWYSIALTGKSGRPILVYDGYDEEPRIFAAQSLSRLSSGLESRIMAVTMVVDTKAIMGMNLTTLADHFAVMTLAQTRATNRCRNFATIVNLMLKDCDPAYTPQAITGNDIALLTAHYKVLDDRMELLQGMRIIGNMRRTLENQVTGKDAPEKPEGR